MKPASETSTPLEISVVLYPENGLWIAQGLEFDIVARGMTPNEASKRFDAKVGAELVMSTELNDERPLSGVSAAPQKFWQMFEAAEMRLEKDETPLRLSDSGASIRPRMRMTDKHLAVA